MGWSARAKVVRRVTAMRYIKGGVGKEEKK